MKTITIKVYSADELSESAKEKAHGEYLASGDYFSWFPEWNESLNAFCAIAPIDWIRFDVTAGCIDCTSLPEDIAGLSGARAWKWLYNNGWFDLAEKNAQGDCTLTGYCGDCPLFDPIHALRDRPQDVPDLEQVFCECLQSWVFACRADQEDHESLEHFLVMADMNDWRFLECGRMV